MPPEGGRLALNIPRPGLGALMLGALLGTS